jgi:hypothetical protein
VRLLFYYRYCVAVILFSVFFFYHFCCLEGSRLRCCGVAVKAWDFVGGMDLFGVWFVCLFVKKGKIKF